MKNQETEQVARMDSTRSSAPNIDAGNNEVAPSTVSDDRVINEQIPRDFSRDASGIKYGTLGVPLALRREPTEKDFADPRFDVLWELMKRVDVQHADGLFSGATGNDVCAVLDALDRADSSISDHVGISSLQACRCGVAVNVSHFCAALGHAWIGRPDPPLSSLQAETEKESK